MQIDKKILKADENAAYSLRSLYRTAHDRRRRGQGEKAYRGSQGAVRVEKLNTDRRCDRTGFLMFYRPRHSFLFSPVGSEAKRCPSGHAADL